MVRNGGVGAAGDDRRVGGTARAPTSKGVVDRRLELVFVGAAVRQTSRLAELEWLGPDRIPGIAVHGDEALPR